MAGSPERLSRLIGFRCGALLARLGASDTAARCLRILRSWVPSCHLCRAALAVLLLESGRPTEALDEIEPLLGERPGSALAHFLRGCAHHGLGDHDAAIGDFTQALQTGPASPQLLYNLGVSLSLRGRWEEAVQVYGEALTLAPESPDICENLGSTLSCLARWSEAVQWHQRAHALNPSDHTAINLAHTLRQLERYEEAEGVLRAVLLTTNSADVKVHLALALVDLDRPEEAARLAAEAHEAPTPETTLAVATALAALDRPAEARALLAESTLVDPGNPDYQALLGWIRLELRDYVGALAAFDESVEDAAAPAYVRAWRLAGKAVSEHFLGERTAAARHAEAAVALDPDVVRRFPQWKPALDRIREEQSGT